MTKRAPKGYLEQDAFTGWRRLLTYMSRPGVASAAKRKANRRDRHDARRAIRQNRTEG